MQQVTFKTPLGANGLIRIYATLVLLAYLGTLYFLHGLRKDHFLLGAVWMFFHFTGSLGRKIFPFLFPFWLTAVLYDSQRHFGHLIRAPIHVFEPYYFDKTLFGIHTKNGILTPNEWWQLHTHPAFDFISGIAYLTFFTVFILISAYFVLHFRPRSSSTSQNEALHKIALRMPWAFLWVNILGYSTYYWYPAAPPWYVAEHGLGPLQLDIPAGIAGCVRFDQLLGMPIFKGMYSRAADVFGAVPSLHVAYPFLATVFSFYLGRGRLFCLCFYFIMCFSAVYLNHHYILDLIWGSAYSLGIAWICIYWQRPIEKLSRYFLPSSVQYSRLLL